MSTEGGELKRELSLLDLVFLGMGAIIGSGIFMIPGIAARSAGPASLFIWVLVGGGAIIMSLVIAELAAFFQDAGGPYTYVRNAFGNLPGFVVAWLSCIISWITISMLVSAATEYLSFVLPFNDLSKVVFNIVLLAVLVKVNTAGVRSGALLQSFLSGFALLVLAGLAAVGASQVEVTNLVAIPDLTSATIIATILIIIEPFIGWEAVTFLGEEAADPTMMPKAIIITTVGVTIVYFLVSFTALGVVPSAELGESHAPLSLMAKEILGPTIGSLGSNFMALAAFLIMVGTANSWVLSSSRLPYSMARRGHFPSLLAELNDADVPYAAIYLQFIISSVFLAWGKYEALLHLLVPLALILYLSVTAAHPVIVRRFGRVPGYRPAIPIVVSIVCAALSLGALTLVHVPELVMAAGVILSGVALFAGRRGYLYISGETMEEDMRDEGAAAPATVTKRDTPKEPPKEEKSGGFGDGSTSFWLFLVLGVGAILGIGLAIGFMFASSDSNMGLQVIVGIVEVAAIIPLVLLLFYFVYELELTEFKRIKERFMELELIFEKIEEQYVQEEKILEKEVIFIKDEENMLHEEITELKETVNELKNLLVVEQSLKHDVERIAEEEVILEHEAAELIKGERELNREVRLISAEEKELKSEIGDLREAIDMLHKELRDMRQERNKR